MNDERNISLIKEALIAYEDGAMLECLCMLTEVCNSINAFDIAMELSEGEIGMNCLSNNN